MVALRSLLPDGLPDSVAQILFDNEGNSFQVQQQNLSQRFRQESSCWNLARVYTRIFVVNIARVRNCADITISNSPFVSLCICVIVFLSFLFRHHYLIKCGKGVKSQKSLCVSKVVVTHLKGRYTYMELPGQLKILPRYCQIFTH